MKKFKFAAFFLVFSLVLSMALAPGALALDDPDVSVGAAVLYERNTRQILFQQNADAKMYPASTTKIMTVLLAIEAVEAGSVSMDDQVTAGDTYHQDFEDDGSTANIVPGETMSLRDLLYCAMLASANEACNIIAEYVSGSIESFVSRMNQRAEELGCTGTHFVNTHGYQNESHYTTANDMVLIADEAADHSSFMEICGAAKYEVPATNVSAARQLSNSNALINEDSVYGENYLYEAATGMKTGHTSDAGYCLISSASKDSKDLICVVLGCQAPQKADGTYDVGNFSNTITLFDWGFDNFSYQDVLSSSTIVAHVSVSMAKDTDSVSLHPKTSLRLFLPNDYDPDSFTQKTVIYSERDGEELVAPISAGDVLGEITILRDDTVIETIPLVATSSVDMSKAAYIKSQISETLHNSTLSKIIKILVILFIIYVVWVIIYRVRHIIHLNSVRKARRERALRIAEREAIRNAHNGYGGDDFASDIDFFSDRPDNAGADSGDSFNGSQGSGSAATGESESPAQSGDSDNQPEGDGDFFKNLFKK